MTSVSSQYVSLHVTLAQRYTNCFYLLTYLLTLKVKYNHGTTEYRGIFPRYLPWRKISGTA